MSHLSPFFALPPCHKLRQFSSEKRLMAGNKFKTFNKIFAGNFSLPVNWQVQTKVAASELSAVNFDGWFSFFVLFLPTRQFVWVVQIAVLTHLQVQYDALVREEHQLKAQLDQFKADLSGAETQLDAYKQTLRQVVSLSVSPTFYRVFAFIAFSCCLCSRFFIQFASISSTFSRISRHRSTVLPTLYPQSFRSDSIRQAINSQIN